MRCIYCNTPLSGIDYCQGCGADVTLLKRIGRISNLLYNRGLEKATVRDMSGAVTYLQQSLKFNKENIDARNLLGLCYYETGEAVAALCEWVISRNLMPEDNLADQYINQVQNDRNQLDAINQSIRKYNQSVDYCREGHEDMAVMQLRKVTARNPHMVKAQQLLALLYMKSGDMDRARRLLKKAAAIDRTNTTTLRYLSYVEEQTGRGSLFARGRHGSDDERQSPETLRYVSGTETVIMPTTFRDSSNVATFINIGLGILLGGAIIWFLAVPAIRQQLQEQANRQVTNANQQLSSGTAQLTDLQGEIDGYIQDVEDANEERDEAVARADEYAELLSVAARYVSGEESAAMDALEQVDESVLDGSALELYEAMKKNFGTAMFAEYYTAGTTAYVGRDYQTAAEQLQKAVDADEEGTQANYFNALFYLGFAYYNLGDYTKSDEIFSRIIEEYPTQATQNNLSAYLSSNQTAAAADTSADDTSGTQGEASMSQQETTASYDPADVAWTDPTTGLHYDMYGNLLG